MGRGGGEGEGGRPHHRHGRGRRPLLQKLCNLPREKTCRPGAPKTPTSPRDVTVVSLCVWKFLVSVCLACVLVNGERLCDRSWWDEKDIYQLQKG